MDLKMDSSQHPADLKPRGVKAPLGLVPFSVYPERAPLAVQAAAEETGYWPDRDYGTKDPRPFLIALIREIEAEADDVARAFGFGAAKYAPWNWQSFAWDRAATTEYFGALCRHLQAVESGEERAEDSGVCHRGHATAGAMIWLWHENKARGPQAAESCLPGCEACRGQEPPPAPAPAPAPPVVRDCDDVPLAVGDRVMVVDPTRYSYGQTRTITELDPADTGAEVRARNEDGHGWFDRTGLRRVPA